MYVYFQDDVTRFWREEKEDGAIYNVYLKKVTYHTISDVSTGVKIRGCHVLLLVIITFPDRSIVRSVELYVIIQAAGWGHKP